MTGTNTDEVRQHLEEQIIRTKMAINSEEVGLGVTRKLQRHLRKKIMEDSLSPETEERITRHLEEIAEQQVSAIEVLTNNIKTYNEMLVE